MLLILHKLQLTLVNSDDDTQMPSTNNRTNNPRNSLLDFEFGLLIVGSASSTSITELILWVVAVFTS